MRDLIGTHRVDLLRRACTVLVHCTRLGSGGSVVSPSLAFVVQGGTGERTYLYTSILPYACTCVRMSTYVPSISDGVGGGVRKSGVVSR